MYWDNGHDSISFTSMYNFIHVIIPETYCMKQCYGLTLITINDHALHMCLQTIYIHEHFPGVHTGF